MDAGVRRHGMKADPPGYLWSKYECFLMSGWWDILHSSCLHVKLWSNSMNQRTNIQMEERKDKNYISLGINAVGIKTYKWTLETRGSKSNSSELLCLSWLPATLMMIRSKMNELVCRHHFPIISMWEIFQTSRAAYSVVSGPIWPKFELVRDFMHVLITASINRTGSKTTEKRWRHRFPHNKSTGADLPQNLMQPFPHPSDATHKIWSRLANWLQRDSSLKVWTTDDNGRTTDHWYTILHTDIP